MGRATVILELMTGLADVRRSPVNRTSCLLQGKDLSYVSIVPRQFSSSFIDVYFGFQLNGRSDDALCGSDRLTLLIYLFMFPSSLIGTEKRTRNVLTYLL